MKVIIFKVDTLISQSETKKIIKDLGQQVKSGIVLLDNRFDYPPIIVDDAAPSESTEHSECKICTKIESEYTEQKQVHLQEMQQHKKTAEEKTKCIHCKDSDNQNAVIYADSENREYFVYCRSCGIETVETFKSKKAALNAFDNGETKRITEGAADD